MDGTNNHYEQNPYEAANQAYQQAAAQPPKKKKNKVPGIILMALGLVVLIGGLAVTLLGSHADALETSEPVDIYEASQTDEYVYTYVQYMTESVAYYEAMDNMQFYIVMDADWSPSVICLHADELETYQPYIDWLYSDSYENEPKELRITGYAQPYDEELKELVIEGFIYDFGEGYVDKSNFSEWFGDYYLQIGQKNGAYQISNAGIIMVLAAIVLIVIGGAMVYEPVKPAAAENSYGSSPIIEDKKPGVAMGILGAFLGALLGGLLWTVVGALGYVSGWIGLLIIIFAHTGYKILSKREDKIGMGFSILFSILVVIPATYLTYVWLYYGAVNEGMSGYTTLTRAMVELPGYMERFDMWGDFFGDIIMGYFFMLVMGIYMLLGTFGKKNKKK